MRERFVTPLRRWGLSSSQCLSKALSTITEMRTAAVSAAVTKYLSAPESRVLALLGSGVQAEAHLEALSRVRKFDEVRVWSRNPEHARSFANRHKANAQPDARAA